MNHVGSDQASPIFYFGRQMKDKKWWSESE